MPETNLRIAFWGTSSFSVYVLEALLLKGIKPTLIITAPPKPKGRGLEIGPSDVKQWADIHHIQTLEPLGIKSEEFMQTLGQNWDLFVVASYGKIMPKTILDLPKHGTLNVHPSLLPKFRGPTPLQSSILEKTPVGEPHEVGVTVMLMDEQVDHGPVVAIKKITIENWPVKDTDLEQTLGILGGKLLGDTISHWVAGDITPTEQNHALATYTKKIVKADALVRLNDDPADILRKVCAFNIWPRAYFMSHRGGREIRVVITEAHIEDNALKIDRVIPEGKREMTYAQFLHGQK